MKIDINTVVMGILGNPLGHSLSPLMHKQALDKMGFNGVYIPFEIEGNRLKEAIDGIRALKIRGVNVTIPFKEKVIPYLDELSEDARACGAVNLIHNQEGRLIGHNTDGAGFVAGLKDAGVSPQGQIVILGAGGAARGVAYALSKAGAEKMIIMARDRVKASQLADFISNTGHCTVSACEISENNKDLLAQASMLVNCTSAGMYPYVDETPLSSLAGMRSDAVVCDIVYNPIETKLLSMAREKGMPVFDGLAMLVHQGALSLALLTGVEPPVAFMRQVLLESMKESN